MDESPHVAVFTTIAILLNAFGTYKKNLFLIYKNRFVDFLTDSIIYNSIRKQDIKSQFELLHNERANENWTSDKRESDRRTNATASEERISTI